MDELPLLPDLLATPDRYAWHAATETAVLADLHLGASGGMGGQATRMALAWKHLAARRPKRVIVAGDVMDDPAVGAGAVADCRGMLGMLPAECQVTITLGNHDPGDLGERLGVKVVEAVRVADYVISHGHVLPALLAEAPGARWIVGHQHPAVTLRTRVQSAKMACFAVCQATSRQPGMILLPAFSRDAGGPLGSNLLAPGNWLLPVPRPNPQSIRIYGLIESSRGPSPPSQVLDFGILSELETLNPKP